MMKLKKLIIHATCFSIALSTIAFSGVVTFADQTVDVKTGEGTASADRRTQTRPSVSTENPEVEIKEVESENSEEKIIRTQSDNSADNDEDSTFTGEKEENGVIYYYESGKKFTGDRKVESTTYYYKDGVTYTGDRSESGVKYYYTDGIKTDKYLTIEGTSVKVSIKGNKWVNLKGYWHFVKDGTLIKGWRNLTKVDGQSVTHYSYFDKTNGRLYTGWHKMGKAEGEKTEHWSYFGPNGWLRTGWQGMGTTTNPDGKNKAHWSYFGKDGWLVTGWKYLTKSDGEKTAHFSYFGSNGWLRTGWQSMGRGTPNSFGENSAKHWSYFGNNGWLRTGMQTMATSTNPDGKNKIHLSYFGGNGWLVENKVFNYSNAQYIANTSGWATRVTTEVDKTLVRAYQLVAKVTNSNMTKEQKLRACYDHIKNDYAEYNPRIPHYAGEGWLTMYANDIFVSKGGNCISYGAAFAFMAKAIGYDNVVAVNGTGHGWAEVNGKVYDPEWEKHHSGSYYAVNYNDTLGTQKYNWIFSSSNPYARIKL